MTEYHYCINTCGPAFIVTVYELPSERIHSCRGFESEEKAQNYAIEYIEHLKTAGLSGCFRLIR